MPNSNAYKYEEIKEHFEDFIQDQDKDWIKENFDDLHHHAFNNDYYIIGTYQAKKWLGDEVFEIINIIKEYENMNETDQEWFRDIAENINRLDEIKKVA